MSPRPRAPLGSVAILVALVPAFTACSTSAITASTTGGASSPSCGATSASMRDCVQAARLSADLTYVAKERVPGSPHWQEVQDLCKARFEQYGFQVELQPFAGQVVNREGLLDNASGVNVIGKKLGTTRPGNEVLVSGHYDHIPGCAGADDNATAVAGVLEAARILGSATFPDTLVVACWDQEEYDLLGSTAYAARAKQRGENVAVMYSFEMLGYQSSAPNSQQLPDGFSLLFPTQTAALAANQNRGDFLAILPSTPALTVANRVAFHAEAIGLSSMVFEITPDLATSALAAQIRRSDHAPFWDQGYPAMMVTDTANFRYADYHCMGGPDVVENIDQAFFTLNVRALIGSAADALQM